MTPRIAVIARCGAHKPFARRGLKEKSMLVPETPFGSANPVHLFEGEAGPFAVLSRHGEDGYSVSAPFVNDRANIWALKSLGVEKIISWSAPGSIDTKIEPGDLAVPDDIFDWRAGEPVTFFEGRGPGVIRANPAFCPEIRSVYFEVMRKLGRRCHEGGTYAVTRGPRLETAAEVRFLSQAGASLVGMTIAPELWLARELEICYSPICYSVNFAEGIVERPYRADILFEGLATEAEMKRVEETEEAFADIILALLPVVAATLRQCPCPRLLDRYRSRGDIEGEWWRRL